MRSHGVRGPRLLVAFGSAVLYVLGCICAVTAQAQEVFVGLQPRSERVALAQGIVVQASSVKYSDFGSVDTSGEFGFVYGRFARTGHRAMLKLSWVDERTIRITGMLRSGVRSEKLISLPYPISSRFWVISGFTLSDDGIEDLAIVDRNAELPRWFIIRNPLHAGAKVSRTFVFGTHGATFGVYPSRKRGVRFLSVDWDPEDKRIRAKSLELVGGGKRELRGRIRVDPRDFEVLRLARGRSKSVALYSAAKRKVLVLQRARVEQFRMPRRRCNGEQRPLKVTAAGTITSLEICPDNRYVVSRREHRGAKKISDRMIERSSLRSSVQVVRRGDLSSIVGIGSGPPLVIVIPSAYSLGSSGTEPRPVIVVTLPGGATFSAEDQLSLHDGPDCRGALLSEVVTGETSGSTTLRPVQPLSEGLTTFSVRLVDSSGNVRCAANPITYRYDVTPPTVSFNPSVGISSGAQASAFTVTGSCSEPQQAVSLRYGPLAAGHVASGVCSDGRWSVTVDLSLIEDGEIPFTVSLTDPAGNTTAVSSSYVKNLPICENALRLATRPYANSHQSGIGTPEKPIVICNYEQLVALAETPADWGLQIKLGADIDAASSGSSGVRADPDTIPSSGDEYWEGFPMIGACGPDNQCSRAWLTSPDDLPFSGVFDGDNRTISNLSIRKPNRDHVGLFALIGTAGLVKNVRLSNVAINQGLPGTVAVTGQFVGGVAGASLGTVESAHASGSVKGFGLVGGAIGHNDGTILASSAQGSVEGYGPVAGLAGDHRGIIRQSFSSANVVGGATVGGLVGLAFDGYGTKHAIISDSYATGSVTVTGASSTQIGGLAARVDRALIIRSYSTGAVNASTHDQVGGLVGNMLVGAIVDCFTTSNVTGRNDVGGAVGLATDSNRGMSLPTPDGFSITGSTVHYTSAHGQVSGVGNVGGLIGNNRGIVVQSSAHGDVLFSGSNGGGFFGTSCCWFSQATTYDSYASGGVYGGTNAGGFHGRTDGAANYRNFAVGALSGTGRGGFIGAAFSSSVYDNNFWNSQTTGLGTTAGTATGLTNTQFAQSASFTGFDFTSVWSMSTTLGRPVLRRTGTAAWDFNSVWAPGSGGAFPRLRWEEP